MGGGTTKTTSHSGSKGPNFASCSFSCLSLHIMSLSYNRITSIVVFLIQNVDVCFLL